MTAILNFDAVQLAAMRKGWGIKETAREAGLSGATLFQVRKRGGRGCPRTFGKVARALGVDVMEIVTLTDGSREKKDTDFLE